MKRLDPRTKIVMIICLSGAAMLTDNPLFLAGLLIFDILLMAVGRVGAARLKKQLAGAVGIVAFIFVLQTLFGQWELGAVLAMRLLTIIMSALILLTGQPRDYLLAMVQCRLPYELAYMVILAFHFFPILKEEAQDVYYSIQLRGTELARTSLRKKLTAYGRMCIPIMAGAMERAKDTATAMEARGFRSKKERTYMRRLKLKKRDIVIMIAAPLLAALFVFAAYNYDDFNLGARSSAIEGREAALSIIDEDSVSISWSDDRAYDGVAVCGDREFPATREEISEGSYYRYSSEVDELKSGKTYKYSVGDGSKMSENGSFTFEPDVDSFSFMFIGDIQYQLRDRDYGLWGDMLSSAYEQNDDAAFVLLAGDMVEKGPDPQDWKTFFTNGEAVFSRIPMMPTVGNHETSKTPSTYLKMMDLPADSPLPEEVYSFDYGDCHFISLNSCLFMDERKSEDGYDETVKEVNDWLEADLAGSDAAWKVVYMHHPMYPITEDDDIYEELRENWEDILKAGGVDLVLCGHQHAYMRTDKIGGITYIMARSGEKSSYYVDENTQMPDYVAEFYEDSPVYIMADVSPETFEITAYDRDGTTIDSCTLEH